MLDWFKRIFQPQRKEPTTPTFPYELPSPKNRIKLEDIETVDEADGTTSIKVKNLPKGTHPIGIAPTNSMEPFIDDGMVVILSPFNGDTSNLIVGDIIDYALPFVYNGFGGAFHRIISIGEDSQGWYCLTKGDNPVSATDPIPVRGEYIRRIYEGVWR